jgi:hypothetical protein
MKCSYCGKIFEGEGASLYAQGELIAAYCTSGCMGKAFKKMSKLIRNNKEAVMQLFDDLPAQSSPARCKDCKHIEKWETGGSFTFYCSITMSHRTNNGLKKVLCKTIACELFEKEKTK